jgi:LuxR family maltose regulon positive regulatory protein
VRTEQLRLNTKETHAFLKDVMYLNLAPELVRKIARRTEGWLAGLQLLGLSLHNCANPAEVLKRSNGNHRYILDYLTEEVLRQQSAEIRQFLLQTSILKRLSAPLCNAVIEKTDSQNILTYLEHANVFLIPLDEERNWYRYHTLFADTLYVLLKQEDPDVISQLHLRASQWYASHDILVEAVQHALQAQAWQRVADLVEPFTEALMTQKYVHIWRYCEEIPMMLRWLHQLPAEIVHTRPHLSLYYARSLFIAGHPTEAERWLQTAETELLISAQDSSTVYKSADDDHEKLQGEIIARRAIIAAYRGDNQAAQDYCQQANSYLSAEHVFQQSLIAVARGMIAFNMGQLPAATQQLLLASTLSQHVGMPGDIINYMSMAASFLHMQGQLHEAYNVLQQAIRRGMGIRPDSYPLAIVGVAYVYQADILREWNQLEQALELIQQGIRFIEQTKYTHYLDVAYTVLTRIYLSRNDVDEAQRVLQQVKHIPAFEENPDRQSWLIAMEQARICITQGKLDAAIATRSIPDRENYASSRLSQDREATALARLTLARGQYAQALTCLEPLLNNAIITNRQDHVIEIRLLQALAYQGQQDEQHALTALAEAVQQAAPETYMRRFLDEGPMLKQLLEKLKKQEQRQELTSYLDKLLNAFPTAEHDGKQNMTATDLQQSNHASLPLFIEPLSKREQEVLQLIAQGASNQEIAQQLTISINTVKGHTSNILMKLEASNRTQAVNLALSLGLLTLE